MTRANLENATHLLERYVSQFEELFELQNMSFNVHLLTHLNVTIKNLGSMWVHNASIFESWNKKIMDKVTSPHGRTNQIVTRFLMTKFVESAIYSDSISIETNELMCETLKIPNLADEVAINNNFQAASSPNIRRLQEVELNVLRETRYVPQNNPSFYAKIKINGIDYHSQNSSANKFCNSVISFNNRFGEILSIIDFENKNTTKVEGFFYKSI